MYIHTCVQQSNVYSQIVSWDHTRFEKKKYHFLFDELLVFFFIGHLIILLRRHVTICFVLRSLQKCDVKYTVSETYMYIVAFNDTIIYSTYFNT